jgi:hypothetical protein
VPFQGSANTPANAMAASTGSPMVRLCGGRCLPDPRDSQVARLPNVNGGGGDVAAASLTGRAGSLSQVPAPATAFSCGASRRRSAQVRSSVDVFRNKFRTCAAYGEGGGYPSGRLAPLPLPAGWLLLRCPPAPAGPRGGRPLPADRQTHPDDQPLSRRPPATLVPHLRLPHTASRLAYTASSVLFGLVLGLEEPIDHKRAPRICGLGGRLTMPVRPSRSRSLKPRPP